MTKTSSEYRTQFFKTESKARRELVVKTFLDRKSPHYLATYLMSSSACWAFLPIMIGERSSLGTVKGPFFDNGVTSAKLANMTAVANLTKEQRLDERKGASDDLEDSRKERIDKIQKGGIEWFDVEPQECIYALGSKGAMPLTTIGVVQGDGAKREDLSEFGYQEGRIRTFFYVSDADGDIFRIQPYKEKARGMANSVITGCKYGLNVNALRRLVGLSDLPGSADVFYVKDDIIGVDGMGFLSSATFNSLVLTLCNCMRDGRHSISNRDVTDLVDESYDWYIMAHTIGQPGTPGLNAYSLLANAVAESGLTSGTPFSDMAFDPLSKSTEATSSGEKASGVIHFLPSTLQGMLRGSTGVTGYGSFSAYRSPVKGYMARRGVKVSEGNELPAIVCLCLGADYVAGAIMRSGGPRPGFSGSIIHQRVATYGDTRVKHVRMEVVSDSLGRSIEVNNAVHGIGYFAKSSVTPAKSMQIPASSSARDLMIYGSGGRYGTNSRMGMSSRLADLFGIRLILAIIRQDKPMDLSSMYNGPLILDGRLRLKGARKAEESGADRGIIKKSMTGRANDPRNALLQSFRSSDSVGLSDEALKALKVINTAQHAVDGYAIAFASEDVVRPHPMVSGSERLGGSMFDASPKELSQGVYTRTQKISLGGESSFVEENLEEREILATGTVKLSPGDSSNN